MAEYSLISMKLGPTNTFILKVQLDVKRLQLRCLHITVSMGVWD